MALTVNFTTHKKLELAYHTQQQTIIITDSTFWYQTTVFGVTQLTSTE